MGGWGRRCSEYSGIKVKTLQFAYAHCAITLTIYTNINRHQSVLLIFYGGFNGVLET